MIYDLVSIENLGNGVGIFSGITSTPTVNNLLEIKSLLAGTGITLTDQGNTILVQATGSTLPPYFINLTDGPRNVVANAILIGNSSGELQWSIPATGNNVTLVYTGNTFSWVPIGQTTTFVATGDSAINVTTSSNSTGQTIQINLSNTSVIPGTYNHTTLSVDSKGRITSISNGITNSITSFGLSGDGNIIISTNTVTNFSNVSFSLANTNVIPGTYNYASVSVDSKGRIIAISNGIISNTTTSFRTNGTADIGVVTNVTTNTVTISLNPTTVAAGTYNYSSIIVDQNGRITNAVSSNVVTRVNLVGDANINIANSPITNAGSIYVTLANTSVVPGTYSSAIIVVDSYGRIQRANTGANTFTAFASISSNTSVSIYAGNSSTNEYFSSLQASNNISLTVSNTTTFSGQLANSGIITFDLVDTGIVAGTYNSLVVDSKGRALIGSYTPSGAGVNLTGDVIGNTITQGFYANNVYTPPSITTTLASIATPGTYNQIVIDSKGRVISGANIAVSTFLGYTPVNKSGDTISGTLTVNSGVNITGNLQLFGANTITKEIIVYSTMNSVTSNRWIFGVTNGDYPGGNNTGGDFVFSAYSDSGSFIITPITITRATGLTTFSANVAIGPGYASNFNISFGTSEAAPTFNTSSIGSRLILLPSVSNTATDYALGVSPGGQGLWMSLPQYNSYFNFLIYGGTQVVHTFDAVGNYTPGNGVFLGNQKQLNFTDTAGNHPYITCQNDNNLVFYATNNSGGYRAVWGIVQNSSNSSFNFGVPATAITVSNTDNTSNIATTAFVKNQNYLTTNQNITLSGDISGSGTNTINTTLANIGTVGTYYTVTTDSKGRVISGSNTIATPVAFSFPGQPPSNTTVGVYIIQTTIIQSNFAGSGGYAITPATNSATFSLSYIRGNSSNFIGNIVFAASSKTPSFSTTNAVTLITGDFLYLVSPSNTDATLTTVGITLSTMRY